MVIMYNRISEGIKQHLKEIITHFTSEIVLHIVPAKQTEAFRRDE